LIPLREQEAIRLRFEQELSSRVRIDYFSQRQSRVIVPGRQECVHCEDVRLILVEIAHLGTHVSLSAHELYEDARAAAELGVDKAPCIVIRGQANRPMRFSGLPAGSQFPGFIDTIIEASRQASALKPETQRQLRKLKQDVALQVFVTPSCPYSPAVAHAAFRLGLQSPRVKVEVIEIVEFPALAQRLDVRGTPATLIDGRLLIPGGLDEAGLLRAVFKAVDGKPLSGEDFTPGPITPLPQAAPQQQKQAPQLTASGLFLPR
jgi:glutaredoxin-like protein